MLLTSISGHLVEILALSLLFGGPLVFGVIYTAIHALDKGLRHRRETMLKLRMIERGFTASEIQAVLHAESADPPPETPPSKPLPPPRRRDELLEGFRA